MRLWKALQYTYREAIAAWRRYRWLDAGWRNPDECPW